jgi:tetratricopeptide (TPR) repeat protein
MSDIRYSLAQLANAELVIVARKLKIKGRGRLRKEGLIEAILQKDPADVRRSLNLTWWDRHKNSFFGWIGVGSFVVGLIALLLPFFRSSAASQLTLGPNREILQKATRRGLRQELSHGAAKLADEAEAHFDVAEGEFQHGRYREAASAYLHSASIIPTAAAYKNAGNSYLFLRAPPDAEKAFLAGLRIARERRDRSQEAEFLTSLGVVSMISKKWTDALRWQEDALTLFNDLNDTGGPATVFVNKGVVFFGLGQNDQALAQFAPAIQLIRKLHVPRVEAGVLANLGSLDWRQGRHAQAVEQYQKALQMAKRLGDRRLESEVLFDLGQVYADQWRLDDALASYESAAEVYAAVGDREGRALVLDGIGEVYLRQRRLEDALQTSRTALALYQELKDDAHAANVLNRVGVIYGELRKFEDAVREYESALRIYQRLEDGEGVAKVLNNGSVAGFVGECYGTTSPS